MGCLTRRIVGTLPRMEVTLPWAVVVVGMGIDVLCGGDVYLRKIETDGEYL